MDPTTGAPSRRELPLAFTASGSEYFRIWIVNLLLTVVTLGLYLPFAKARRLRYFYANTLVDDQPLAFHGDPWTMFRGHLVVVGFGAAYFLSGKFVPELAFALVLAFMLLWPALWRSSLVFRLRNTSWRGIRFGFTGSLGGAYKCFLPWLGLVLAIALFGALAAGFGNLGAPAAASVALVVTLVLGFYALAFVAAAMTWLWLKRYQHGSYRIAQQQGELRMSLGDLLRLGLKALGLTLLALTVGVLLISALLWMAGSAGNSGSRSLWVNLGPVLGMLLLYAVLLFTWGPYVGARLQDLLWSGTRSRQLRFRSRLSARALAWLTLKNWLLIIITLGLYRPFAVVATTRLRLQAVRIGLLGEMDGWFGEAAAAQEHAIGEMGGDFFGFDVGL